MKQTYGKKPLSAAFDKLGNNATLAISLCQELRKIGFSVIPQDKDKATRAAIEVYPGIVKAGNRKIDRAIGPVDRHIPSDLEAGTDEYDAAICAILGVAYAVGGNLMGLPNLVQPPSGQNVSEGWIYSLPAEFVWVHQR